MSRRIKLTSAPLKPVAVRTRIYDTDSRHRLRSTGPRSKKVGSSRTAIATSTSIVEALSIPPEAHMCDQPEEIPLESEEEGWVDEDLDDLPSTKKSGMLQSPNRHLREWLNEHSESYITLLFLRDAAPTGDD
ncbi:hypothetical protein FS749_011408, partial [Ceratobasidium sp. UAMH 11750]